MFLLRSASPATLTTSLLPVGRRARPHHDLYVVQGPRTTVTRVPRGHSLTNSSPLSTREGTCTVVSVRSIARIAFRLDLLAVLGKVDQHNVPHL